MRSLEGFTLLDAGVVVIDAGCRCHDGASVQRLKMTRTVKPAQPIAELQNEDRGDCSAEPQRRVEPIASSRSDPNKAIPERQTPQRNKSLRRCELTCESLSCKLKSFFQINDLQKSMAEWTGLEPATPGVTGDIWRISPDVDGRKKPFKNIVLRHFFIHLRPTTYTEIHRFLGHG